MTHPMVYLGTGSARGRTTHDYCCSSCGGELFLRKYRPPEDVRCPADDVPEGNRDDA